MAVISPVVKRYSVPLFLFAAGLFFQLVVLPHSFPQSHYDVLGIKRFASVEEVTEAYNKLSSKWSSGSFIPTTVEFIKIRYALELLTNPVWKRDYDLFGVDEQLHLIEKVKEQYDGEKYSKIGLPLLDASSSDLTDQAFNVLSTENFISIINESKTSLIQVYSTGSPRCAKFISSWKSIAGLLDGVADTFMVELGDVQLASYLAERKSNKQPFFLNGLPAIVAFPPNCKSSDCYVRYQGDLSVGAVVDWMSTNILGFPRILYYSKETLVENFIVKSGLHKVKVICFSKTGERAVPFLREAAQDYWSFASFGAVLWREEESSIWWNLFNVESAPAFVFLKEPGVKPVVYHGNLNRLEFYKIMEKNKHQELPQLRSVTAVELGCDAKGFSRAGKDTVTWYCVILAGRLSVELNKLRGTMRTAQSMLLGDADLDNTMKNNISLPVPAATAVKEHRLTFAWLDGDAQKKFCSFYLHSENVYETCGPSGYYPTDVPRLFIVRYKRNATENELKVKNTAKTIWDTFQEEDVNAASQLVARYNGSENIQEIIQWIVQTVEHGETNELQSTTFKTPELIPEDKNAIWSKSSRVILSAGMGTKQKVWSIISAIGDHMGDPWIGPILLLAACISFGTISLQSSRTNQTTKKDEEGTTRTRRRKAKSSNHERPSSITDAEPKDAYQILPSDSDSE